MGIEGWAFVTLSQQTATYFNPKGSVVHSHKGFPCVVPAVDTQDLFVPTDGAWDLGSRRRDSL